MFFPCLLRYLDQTCRKYLLDAMSHINEVFSIFKEVNNACCHGNHFKVNKPVLVKNTNLRTTFPFFELLPKFQVILKA